MHLVGGMTPQELRDRTDRFSLDIINLCRGELPADILKLRILTQLQDAGTSVASNYHAACRAQSRAAFVAKLSIAVEEAEECVGWLHKLAEAKLVAPAARLAPLRQEALEILKILAASRTTASGRRRPPQSRNQE